MTSLRFWCSRIRASPSRAGYTRVEHGSPGFGCSPSRTPHSQLDIPGTDLWNGATVHHMHPTVPPHTHAAALDVSARNGGPDLPLGSGWGGSKRVHVGHAGTCFGPPASKSWSAHGPAGGGRKCLRAAPSSRRNTAVGLDHMPSHKRLIITSGQNWRSPTFHGRLAAGLLANFDIRIIQ
jgi:hypothetical protein